MNTTHQLVGAIEIGIYSSIACVNEMVNLFLVHLPQTVVNVS